MQNNEEKVSIDYSYRILKFLGELVAGADHEINNLLLMIEGSAHILLDTDPSPEKRTLAIDAISNKTKRIQEVMAELRSILKDGTDEKFKSLTVKELTSKAISLCRTRFKNHRIFFSINISEDLQIEGRETQLIQALLAILTSSHEAIVQKKERWVKIDVLELDKELAIKVEDSGDELTLTETQELFKPFFTSHDGRQGVGLALAKHIIEGHRGVIEIKNIDQKPCVLITLPRYQPEASSGVASARVMEKYEIYEENVIYLHKKKAA